MTVYRTVLTYSVLHLLYSMCTHGYPDVHRPSLPNATAPQHLRLQHQQPADCNFISRAPAKRALAQARRLRRARPIQSTRLDSARLDLT